MGDRWLADVVVGIHAGFIVFVVTGGLATVRWPRLMGAHLGCAAWGALVELMGWTCPLTPLENRLRARAGMMAYEESFVERYLIPLIYPATLTREMQVVLGLGVVVLNAAIYAWVKPWRRLRSAA